MQSHHTDITGVSSVSFAIIGFITSFITSATPALAGISYLIAIIAGIVTIYYKIKNKK